MTRVSHIPRVTLNNGMSHPGTVYPSLFAGALCQRLSLWVIHLWVADSAGVRAFWV